MGCKGIIEAIFSALVFNLALSTSDELPTIDSTVLEPLLKNHDFSGPLEKQYTDYQNDLGCSPLLTILNRDCSSPPVESILRTGNIPIYDRVGKKALSSRPRRSASSSWHPLGPGVVPRGAGKWGFRSSGYLNWGPSCKGILLFGCFSFRLFSETPRSWCLEGPALMEDCAPMSRPERSIWDLRQPIAPPRLPAAKSSKRNKKKPTTKTTPGQQTPKP